MTRTISIVGILIALAIGGWLFAEQSKNEGPTAPAVTQAEGQALLATASANFSQVVPALQGQYAQTGSYAGAQVPPGAGVSLVSASSTSYCLESKVNGTVVHEVGPGGSPAAGPC